MSSPIPTPALPAAFAILPVAHRALHDLAAGRPENSREAVRAAVEAGYGIEIDLQLSSDGAAMVFHDYTLDRVTAESGPVDARHAAELAGIRLTGGESGIPTFAEVLELVGGRVPLLVELKDQDGRSAHAPGTLEAEAARVAAGYAGPIAFMSFNPAMVGRMAELAPEVPRGITTCAYEGSYFAHLGEDQRKALQDMAFVTPTGSSFVSHEAADLARPSVQALRQAGLTVLCWTIRSPEAEAEARALSDNITFEHYRAAFPAAIG